MKQNISKILAGVLCVAILIGFGAVLSSYARPMKNVSLNLSLTPEGEAIEPEAFDDKGWTVYTREGDTVTELEPDGFGGYLGSELGQTIYFSRVLSEELDDPTLQLDGEYSEFTFSVFLDGELLYTDYPEMDNRMGYLHLPMSFELREEPLKLSLPRNYVGKTLTIAQSTPDWSEPGTVRAYPANVVLYCGYAYESTLITESFFVFTAAAALFLLGVILLIAFLRNRKLATLAAALISMLWMCSVLTDAAFYPYYFGYRMFNWRGICFGCSALLLMAVLSARALRFKKILWSVTALFGVSVSVYGVIMVFTPLANATPLMKFLMGPAMEWVGVLAMITFLVLGILWWKKSRFYALFTSLSLGFGVIWWVYRFLTDGNALQTLLDNFASGYVTRVFYDLLPCLLLAALCTVLWEAFRGELEQRMEKRLIQEQKELTLASYENLRRQHEEVMMLRHDMNRHFHTLQEMSKDEKVTAYLAELIGQNEKIRPVVQSGNETLDIILNGKIAAAADAGIEVQILKAEAPEQLPISDADLCSLLMNILDNAITAAGRSEAPLIRVNIHAKHDLLAIACENSTDGLFSEEKTETVPKHGLGLKIIRGIVDRSGGSMDTDHEDNHYRLRILLPLD